MKKLPIAITTLLGVVVATSPLAALANDSTDTSVSTSVNTEVSTDSRGDKKDGIQGLFNLKFRLDDRQKTEAAQRDRDRDREHQDDLRKGTVSSERNGTSTRNGDDKKIERGGDLATVKARATAEIDGRIARLNAQIKRVGEMDRLSAEQKASIAAELSAQVTNLTALKVKIAAETDIAMVREHMKSVTKAYRVYLVTMPKAAITAAADRIMNVAAQMETFSAKLSARITASASVEVKAALADMNAKIADAKVQAQAGAALVANLQADNGDTAIAASNAEALKSAKAKIEAGQADLKAARKDMEIIMKGIRGNSEVKASARAEAGN
jgi:hypothetical protein